MPIKDKHFDSHSLLKFLRNKTFIDYRKVNCQFKLTIMASKRKFLTLEERVKVISLLGKGHSCRRVASDLGVGKTQIQSILKRKHEIMDEFEENVNCESKRPKRESEFASVNDLVHKWFVDASARLLPVSGPMIQEKALKFACELGYLDFKANKNIKE